MYFMLFCLYFVQFSNAFHGSGGLFGFFFGFKKLCFCRCGISQRHNIWDSSRSGRLLGGEVVTPHQFPWLTSISTGSQIFQGALISNRHVVTAASPLSGVPAGEVFVTLGSHDRCVKTGDAALNISVAAVLLHPAYSASNKHNDIALLRLTHLVPFSQFISPVCLPFYGSHESGGVAWIVSWKERKSNSSCTPRVNVLPILSTRVCFQGDLEPGILTPEKGCLGPLGAKNVICKTDVGSPVMVRYSDSFHLLGIISSSSCNIEEPPRYTRISEHLYWIYHQIRTDCLCF